MMLLKNTDSKTLKPRFYAWGWDRVSILLELSYTGACRLDGMDLGVVGAYCLLHSSDITCGWDLPTWLSAAQDGEDTGVFTHLSMTSAQHHS